MATFHGIVYVITNTVNSKVYVGSTKKTLYMRWREHQNAARNGSAPLHVAMREVGVENFNIKVVLEVPCNTVRELHEAESRMLKKYCSLKPNGYNANIPVSLGLGYSAMLRLRRQYGAN